VSRRVLELSDDLAAAVLVAAARAYPLECCGLVEGLDTKEGWRVFAIHETKNVASDPRRAFLIDPQAQFDLMRALRGSERRVVGCFHSHPDGAPEPSATDRAGAYEVGFLYLIAAGGLETGFTLAAHLFTDETGFTPIALA